jgi:hypothetical protein
MFLPVSFHWPSLKNAEGVVSFTPGFSRVPDAQASTENRFNGFHHFRYGNR